jgi:hypothetical protein
VAEATVGAADHADVPAVPLSSVGATVLETNLDQERFLSKELNYGPT